MVNCPVNIILKTQGSALRMLILLWTRRWEITQGSLYHPTCGPPAVAYILVVVERCLQIGQLVVVRELVVG